MWSPLAILSGQRLIARTVAAILGNHRRLATSEDRRAWHPGGGPRRTARHGRGPTTWPLAALLAAVLTSWVVDAHAERPALAPAPADEAAQAALILGVPWPMVGRTAGHTGRSPVVGAQRAALRWSRPTAESGLRDGSPIIGRDGTLFVAEATVLTAFSPAGAPLWKYQPGANLSVPALGLGGTILVGSGAGLVALARDGTHVWTYPSGATATPVVALDGSIYAVGSGPAVYALRPNGTLRWQRALPGIRGMPSVGPDDTVYVIGVRQQCTIDVCFQFGQLFALDPNTGGPRLVYDHAAGGSIAAPAVIGMDGTIYLAAGDFGPSAIVALRPGGSVKWARRVGGGFLSAPALGWDGKIYAGSLDGYVYALRRDGSVAWRFRTEGVGGPGEGSLGVTSSPAIGGDGTVYVGSQDGFLYALYPHGILKWRHETRGDPGERTSIQSSPAIGPDGTVYISGWIGNPQPVRGVLYAFGPGPGTQRASEQESDD